jgi:hypothetical protein
MLLGIIGLLGTALIEQVEINQACRKKEDEEKKDREQIEKWRAYIRDCERKGVSPWKW